MLVLLAPIGASSAVAEDDCSVPMANWRPREAVERLAKTQGWTVRRIEIDDGCYEIEGRDPDGREIEVTVDPATLAIIDVEHENEDDGRGSRHVRPDEARVIPDDGRSAPGDTNERAKDR
jgi:hypothetical protein